LTRLVVPRVLFDQLRGHLLTDLTLEREAFMLGGWDNSNGLDIFVKKIIPIEKGDLDLEGEEGLELKDEKKVQVINLCKRENSCLLEAHTHPFSDRNVDFSKYDLANLKEFVKYVNIRIPGSPYCATVWGTESIAALAWQAGEPRGRQVDEIMVRGKNMQRIQPSNARRQNFEFTKGTSEKYDRQIRAFGLSFQKTISDQKIGIVGAGGTGSHLLQELVYLGVREIFLIDDDKVDTTNLNRLVMAYPRNVGNWKTEVLAKAVRRINPAVKINSKPLKLRSEIALDRLKEVDIIFGCVDNDGARLILTEFSAAYLIPYIDLASEIIVNEGAVSEAGGSVSVYLPLETNCLWCSRKIDPNEASFDLATEEEKGERIKRGYFNVSEPAPAVVSLNGTVASLAANEYLALVSGQRAPRSLRYDFLTSRVIPQKWNIDPNCALCNTNFGLGEKANTKRYVIDDGKPRLI
jgi:molybdopterin-synthase adenylyltransferase